MENNNEQKVVKKNKAKIFIPLILVIIVIIIAGWYWYNDYTKYITTDDAFIDSDKVAVSSKILGRISELYVQEGDSVKKGELVAELDSLELKAQERQSYASRDQAFAKKQQADAKLNLDQESITVQDINFQKATDDFNRAKTQFDGGVITKETMEHIQKTFESEKVKLEEAKTQLTVSKTQILSAQTDIENAEAQIKLNETQLSNCRLYSPFDGVVSKRWLLTGDIAQPGQSIYTLTNNKNLWITIYLEETNMGQIHLNQKVKYTIDAFPGVTFTGNLFSIGSNTASQFSLIPPNNASGNFTKVTQRIPVKISIKTCDKGTLSSYSLLSGMSVVTKIIKE